MATKDFKWRTAPTGTEGVTTVYAHERGCDLTGDGTRARPYQTAGRAWRVSDVKPAKIICAGRFSEMLADGNHSCTISGDHYGAAVFDGAGYYLMYGFRHEKMVFKNTGLGTYDLSVWTGSEVLAGVGSANNAANVGNANNVFGVAGSNTFFIVVTQPS